MTCKCGEHKTQTIHFEEEMEERRARNSSRLPTTKKLRGQEIPEHLEDFAPEDTERGSAMERQK